MENFNNNTPNNQLNHGGEVPEFLEKDKDSEKQLLNVNEMVNEKTFLEKKLENNIMSNNNDKKDDGSLNSAPVVEDDQLPSVRDLTDDGESFLEKKWAAENGGVKNKEASAQKSEEAVVEQPVAPVDEKDRLYTAAELAMQKDNEPFRGTIRYPSQKEMTEEEDRKNFYDKKFAGIEFNKDAAEKILASVEKKPSEVEAKDEKSVVDNPENTKLIGASDSFENLALRIRAGNISIKGTQEDFSQEQLVNTINKIRNKEWPIERATRSDGFRDKIVELLKKEEDAKSIEEVSFEIKDMAKKRKTPLTKKPESAVKKSESVSKKSASVVKNPAAKKSSVKPANKSKSKKTKGGIFSWLRGEDDDK
jgi:hypothetical protein